MKLFIDSEYYADLIRGLGIASGNVSITPFSANGDFSVSATAGQGDAYFDILNPSRGNILPANISTYVSRSVLYGKICLTNLWSASGGGTMETENWLATGIQDVGISLWKYAGRQGAGAVDLNVNNPLVNGGWTSTIDKMPFCFIRKRVTATISGTELCEYFFSGIRIDY